MTDVNNTNSSLNSQCMDFCQTLARQGLEFKFSVTIGSAFTFSLDARAKEGRDAPVTNVKKRNSPSTRRRNARRREEYLKRKFPSEVAKADSPKRNKKQQGDGFHCDLCDSTFKSENGLKIHRGKTHKEHPSPEKVREPPPQPPLSVSPPRSQERVEACHNCGMDMSPAHQCQEDHECDDSDVSEEESSDEEQVEEPSLLSNRTMIGMLLPMIANMNRIASKQ